MKFSYSPGKTNCKFAALFLCVAALVASPLALAQDYEIVAWPAQRPVPALVGTDSAGHQWRLSELRGKAVLINFWASWCPPCLAEMPSLQTLAEIDGPERLVILMVNFKESAGVVQRFVQRSGLNLPVLLDLDGSMARAWGTTVFPTTVLVAADGQVSGVVHGELDWTSKQAGKLLEPLMAAKAQAKSKGVPR